ncbi:MAG: ornithine carbamoyltransferase [Microbispora sp.]|nr:ornithine carbamoyltransferase [Microbispora sp.]
MSHLLSLREFTGEQLDALIRKALEIKQNPEAYRSALPGKGLLLLMQKTSTRTVLAFTAAIHQMGGYAIRMNWDESNFAISPLDLEARYISTTADAVLARLRNFDDVAALAASSSIPVVNGCCSRYHPSQVVADCLTILETAGRMEGVGLAYVGVHNNVTNSLLVGCTRLGIRVNLVTPLRHDGAIDDELVAEAEATGLVRRFDTVAAAVAESDFVYTDTWVDMEHFDDPDYQEEKQRRIALMSPFQLNRENLGGADPWIMHDMPIHPGYEISRELVDAPKSVIFRQAENRLYAAKAILHELMTT